MKLKLTALVRTPAVLGLILNGSQSVLAQGSPVSDQEFVAILESLEITRRAGPMSLRFWVGREGGTITLPPRAAGSNLCVMEIVHFAVDAGGGYSAERPPGRAYWLADSAAECAIEVFADIPELRTYVSDESVAAPQVSAVIARTDEFLDLVSDFPKCGDIEGTRYLAVLGGEPGYIGGLERPSPGERDASSDVLIAGLPVSDDRGGLSVRFSMVDGEFELQHVCNYSPPQLIALEDDIWVF